MSIYQNGYDAAFKRVQEIFSTGYATIPERLELLNVDVYKPLYLAPDIELKRNHIPAGPAIEIFANNFASDMRAAQSVEAGDAVLAAWSQAVPLARSIIDRYTRNREILTNQNGDRRYIDANSAGIRAAGKIVDGFTVASNEWLTRRTNMLHAAQTATNAGVEQLASAVHTTQDQVQELATSVDVVRSVTELLVSKTSLTPEEQRIVNNALAQASTAIATVRASRAAVMSSISSALKSIQDAKSKLELDTPAPSGSGGILALAAGAAILYLANK